MPRGEIESRLRISKAGMDALNAQLSDVAQRLRPLQRRWMDRVLIRYLSSSEYVVLSAITSRTLGWKKVIEKISLGHFSTGLTDLDGEAGSVLMTDPESGVPYFAGTGLDKGTIRAALSGLVRKGVSDRFAIRWAGRDAYAYLPVSANCMMAATHEFKPDFADDACRLLGGFVEPSAELECRFFDYLMGGALDDDWRSLDAGRLTHSVGHLSLH
jgi:hypothetical protein